MASPKTIKTKIRSLEKSRQVTRAMETVSAVKMRKAQQRALVGRPYARAALSILSRLSGAREARLHLLLQSGRAVGAPLYIVVTADRGFAGALNSAVLRAVERDIVARGLAPKEVQILAIGKKGNSWAARRGYGVVQSLIEPERVTKELVEALIRQASERFTMGSVCEVWLVYQNFISTFEQRPTLRKLLPLSLVELEQAVKDIVPTKGAFAKKVADTPAPQTYSIEPGEVEILDSVLPKLAGVMLYHALLEATASEHSARMIAMKQASDKALDMRRGYVQQFNKARQAAITREMSEIVGGMEAVNG